MIEKINPNLLNETFRAALRNKEVFELLVKYLEFHYLPTQEYKEIWKESKQHYQLFNSLPTIGQLAENFKSKPNTLQQLSKVRDADIISTPDLTRQLERYLKDAKFVDLYDTLWELREEGKKEKAFDELQKRAEEIANFSLQARSFESVFKNFEGRYSSRLIENASKHETQSKCIFGIDPLDNRTRGGVDRGKSCLFTARSGIGKSKLLKWIAYSNARLGKKILHFQLEGTREECLLAYEAMIAGTPYYNMKTTAVDDERLKKAIEGSNKIEGDIHVIAYEKFGSASMVDIRNSVVEYIKQNGDIDGIVVDYLDEAEPGDGLRYSPTTEGIKAKKQANAKYFTNICVEFNIAGFIATQASDVDIKIWNNPKEVLTRSNIGSDKNLVNKFSYHITMNQTIDEKKNDVMRLYEDKFRDFSSGETHHIATAYKYEKFFDRKRTINMFSK